MLLGIPLSIIDGFSIWKPQEASVTFFFLFLAVISSRALEQVGSKHVDSLKENVLLKHMKYVDVKILAMLRCQCFFLFKFFLAAMWQLADVTGGQLSYSDV